MPDDVHSASFVTSLKERIEWNVSQSLRLRLCPRLALTFLFVIVL